MKSGIKVIAPACISNLACGYDILGMAVDIPCDEIIGTLSDKPGIRITSITGHKKNIPIDPSLNIVGITAKALLKGVGEEKRGFDFRIHKHLPAGSGLGSSGSSAAATAVLVNELLKNPLEKRALIPYAFEGERASGSTSGDNIIPQTIGGLILVRDITTFDFHRIYHPRGLFVAVLLPDIFIDTKSGREILNPTVPLDLFVKQSANLGAFVLAMQNGDLDLIRRSMHDLIIEDQRKQAIPHFDKVKEIALSMDALGCSISGSGPAIFALCQEKLQASDILKAMQKVYEDHKLPFKSFVTGINNEGAQVF